MASESIDPQDSESRLSNWRVAAFASPAGAISAAGLPITLYVPAYYAGELGLGLVLVGTVVMFTKLWDMITDPLVGMFTDNVQTRWGRRRAWLAAGVPIMIIGGALVYMPERIVPGQSSGTYMFLSLIGLYVGYTLMMVSLTAWGGELSRNYHERTRIQGAIQFAHLVGNFALLCVPIAIEFFGDASTLRQRIEAMGLFMMIVLPITTIIAVNSVPERPVPPQPRIGVVKALSALIKNQNLLRLLFVDFLLALPSAARAAVYIFFMQYVIQRPEWTSTLLVAYFAGNVLAVPVWVKISRILGKHKSVIIALVIHAVFALGYLLPGEGDVLLLAFLQAATAFVYGGHGLLIRSMIADITDADSLETGQQRTGLFYSLITMSNKVGLALGAGIIFPLLALTGFNPEGGNSPEALDGLRYLFVGVPLFAELIAAAILYNYSLDEAAQAKLRAELAKLRPGTAQPQSAD